ncbi:MAG: hypothetical protein Q8N53_13635 [Longimicrobiales bacterium]|nr:hypothetical protein [Longimicrobiales bacterium]
MHLPDDVREQFRRYGREGGRRRAEGMGRAARRTVARRAAAARWIRRRFGAPSFEALGLPGGEVVDAGLADLAAERVTTESLAVSVAAPRLRREGVPIGPALEDPERRLFRLLQDTEGDLAHARYNAWLRQLVSFADACRPVRVDRGGR